MPFLDALTIFNPSGEKVAMPREFPPGNPSLAPLAQPGPPGFPAAGAASLEAIAQAHDPIIIVK